MSNVTLYKIFMCLGKDSIKCTVKAIDAVKRKTTYVIKSSNKNVADKIIKESAIFKMNTITHDTYPTVSSYCLEKCDISDLMKLMEADIRLKAETAFIRAKSMHEASMGGIVIADDETKAASI